MIHAILTPHQAATELPIVLDGKVPPPSDPINLGTADYSRMPIAVVTGGVSYIPMSSVRKRLTREKAYDDATIAEMKKACEGAKGSNIPWLRADKSKMKAGPPPPKGVGAILEPYAEAISGRVKVMLQELEKNGKLGKSGTFSY